MNDLVSVIVPTYNRAYCIERAVDCALNQSHPNVEVIIVDDGSKDETGKLIQARYGNDSRVRYYAKQNGGVASARNLGLTLVRGDFVALLDSDDVWSPWKLELQIACMKARPEVGMIWTDMEAVTDEGVQTHPRFLRTMYHAWKFFTPGDIFSTTTALADLAAKTPGTLAAKIHDGQIPGATPFYAGNVFSPMMMGSLVHTSTVLLRRDRAEKVKSFNVAYTPLGEDYDFHLRTCHEGPVGFIDLPTIKYQTGNPDRLTRRENNIASALNCLKTIAPYLQSPDVTLPPKMITRRLGEIHQWIAEEMIHQMNLGGCGKHAMRSLGYLPASKRSWKLLMISRLPAPLIKWRHGRREKRSNAA